MKVFARTREIPISSWMYVFSDLLKKIRHSGIKLKFCDSTFDALPSQEIRSMVKNQNTCVLSLLFFNEKRNSPVFKVLGVVIYYIIDNYVCIESFLFTERAKTVNVTQVILKHFV